MPDFLTIEGHAIPVAADGASEREPEVVGDPGVRAFDGTFRSTARALKRQWTFTTPPLTHADAATIRGYAPAPGVPLTCAGGFLDGPAGGASSVECSVSIGESPYRPDFTGYPATALGFQRVLTITLRET